MKGRCQEPEFFQKVQKLVAHLARVQIVRFTNSDTCETGALKSIKKKELQKIVKFFASLDSLTIN